MTSEAVECLQEIDARKETCIIGMILLGNPEFPEAYWLGGKKGLDTIIDQDLAFRIRDQFYRGKKKNPLEYGSNSV